MAVDPLVRALENDLSGRGLVPSELLPPAPRPPRGRTGSANEFAPAWYSSQARDSEPRTSIHSREGQRGGPHQAQPAPALNHHEPRRPNNSLRAGTEKHGPREPPSTELGPQAERIPSRAPWRPLRPSWNGAAFPTMPKVCLPRRDLPKEPISRDPPGDPVGANPNLSGRRLPLSA